MVANWGEAHEKRASEMNLLARSLKFEFFHGVIKRFSRSHFPQITALWVSTGCLDQARF